MRNTARVGFVSMSAVPRKPGRMGYTRDTSVPPQSSGTGLRRDDRESSHTGAGCGRLRTRDSAGTLRLLGNDRAQFPAEYSTRGMDWINEISVSSHHPGT